MKSKEELNAIKEEVETVSRKLHELTEEEIAQVTGGVVRLVRTHQHAVGPAVFERIDTSGIYGSN